MSRKLRARWSWPRRPGAPPCSLAFRQLTLLVCAAGCTEPSYVSLGGNVANPLVGDAGPLHVCPEPAASGATPTLAGTCADPTPPAETCELGPSSTRLTSPCDTRTATPCTAPVYTSSGPPESDAIGAVLTALLSECEERENVLRVHFDRGCATGFDLAITNTAWAPHVAACVSERLAAVRYACASNISCGVGKVFSVPLSAVEGQWY